VAIGSGFTRAFFSRDCRVVARALIGAYLVRALPNGTRLAGRIVEVEAYVGDGTDAGSHSHRGITPRNRAMFGPPGRLYVYRSYGIHTCVNVVCDVEGRSAAVLLRAVEPRENLAQMRRLRGMSADRPDREIANGPGKLAQAFDLRMEDYGRSVLRGPVRLCRAGTGEARLRIERSTRIGLTQGADLPYRFYAADNPFVGRTPRRPR